MKNKRKILILTVIILTICVFGSFAYYLYVDGQKAEDRLIAGINNVVEVLDETKENVVNLKRNLQVSMKLKETTINDKIYHEVNCDGVKYYVLKDNLISLDEDPILEKELFVTKECSLYLDDISSKITHTVAKETKLNVVGHSEINDDGSVDRYAVSINDDTYYILSKYVSSNEEDAKIIDEYAHIHEGRDNLYGGGAAYDVDYYINDKPLFENNIMPDECQTLYLNAEAIANIDEYITIANSSNINAFVVDVKDTDVVAYASKVMQEYSPSSYNRAFMSFEEYQTNIKKAKDAGIYIIGRITAFNDSNYAKDHKEDAIVTPNGELLLHNGVYWPSAYSRDVWHYNIELAKEGVLEMGFNEVQFDYMRFPDMMVLLENKGLVDLRNEFNESKIKAITHFARYACDELHKINAYVSGDVFGETSNDYVTAYGQYWPALSNELDVISAMPYPDHFSAGSYGIDIPWAKPYELMKAWGSQVSLRQEECPSPAKVRTWIQGYASIKEPIVYYDVNKIEAQIKGLYENGLDNGFIVWVSWYDPQLLKSFIPAFKEY